MSVEPLPRAFSVAGGVTLRAVQWSSPATHSHVPLVLVHGLASNARLWDGPAREFARRGHPVLALDLRGHGRSDRPDTGYDMATVANDIAEVLGALAADGWQRPLVLGQSWGGNLVVELAHRHPRAVRGVVGVDGGTIELGTSFPDWSDCERLLAPPRLSGDRKSTRLNSSH